MTKGAKYSDVDASPVKQFFVAMLTRDIMVEDAILDLLDNCVDGILRAQAKKSGAKPYAGFKAEIAFTEDTFSISDNCGGIPWSLHDYAFRMGRDPKRPQGPKGAVGVYGIGMKRAVFKMGSQCLISTKSGNDSYEIEISPDWIGDESSWKLPVRAGKKSSAEDGTTVVIGDLHAGIAERFGAERKAFTQGLERMIATHYAFIIDKGFDVFVNGQAVEPRPTKLVFDTGATKTHPAVRPYMFRGKIDGVSVFLAVGFTGPPPSEAEVTSGNEDAHWSTMDAGWTVVCNDRAVLYCDRTELTGWGEAGVPRYHTQFIAIAGVVEFRSDDPSKLPTTTTKRGIDASSTLYLQVKNKMREGLAALTSYTNRWKGNFEESKTVSDA